MGCCTTSYKEVGSLLVSIELHELSALSREARLERTKLARGIVPDDFAEFAAQKST